MFTKPPVFGRRKPRRVVRIGLLVAVVCVPATSALAQTANTIPVSANRKIALCKNALGSDQG